jgi:tight adherence protein B
MPAALPFPVLVLGGLGGLLLVVGLAVSLIGSRTVVEERLGRYAETGGMVRTGTAAARPRKERLKPVADFLDQLGEGTDLFENTSRNLARADIKLRPAEYMALIALAGIGAAIVGTILGQSLVFGMLSGIGGLFVPGAYVKAAQARRLRQFGNQLGDMLNLVVNGLRAGYSTLQAMEAVSKELPAPISDEFRRVVQEIQLGITIEEALNHLLRRISSDDLDLVVTAINVQREVGGNLAEILDVISFTIRERVRIKGEIAALTAQGQITAWVISALPLVLVALLFLINREYVGQFWDPESPRVLGLPCGVYLLCLAGAMVGVGFAAVQKIVRIDI